MLLNPYLGSSCGLQARGLFAGCMEVGDRSCLDVAVVYLTCAPVATSASVRGVASRACAGSCTRGVQPSCQSGTERRTAHRAFRTHSGCGVLPAVPGQIESSPVGRHQSRSRCRRRPAPVHSANGEGTGWPVALLVEVGLSVRITRTGSPSVLVTVQRGWPHRAAITWGNQAGIVTSTVRLQSCPGPRGMWNVYTGGFYLRSRSACVPLVFQVQRRTATVRFGVGRHCGK